MADNTILSAATGTGDVIRTVHKSTYKTPVSLIDVGGTSTGSEAILGDSTHALPVKLMAGSTSLSVSGSTINVHVVSMSGTTSQAVTLTTASTLSVNVSNTVGVSFTTASTAHVDTELPAAAALADNTANPTVPAVGSFLHLWDSTAWDRWPGSSALGGKVYTTTDSTIHATISALTTASTIHVAQSGTWTIAALTTASTVHAQVNALTTASTIHVAQSGTWTIAALTTASTIHVTGSLSATNSAATTDDAAFTPGSGIGTPAMGLVTSDEVSTGDVGVFSMLPNRQQKITLYDSTGVEVTPITGVDDAVFTPGSGVGVPLMGLVTSDAVSTGDVGVLAMLVNRQLKITLYDSTGNEVAVGGGTQYTIGTTGSTANTGTVALGYRKDTAATLVATTGDLTAPIFDASGQQWVNASGSTIPVTLTTGSTVSVNGIVSVSGSTINANVSQSTVNVIAVAGTAGGVSVFNKVGTTVVETTAIKTSAGQVYGISGYNNTLAPIYVKLYNTTAAPTTSLTAVARYILPCSTVTGAAGFVEDYACPVAFSTGIGIRITGGSILDGATEAAASTASLYTVNVRYA
jgi:hypothetical protein